MANWLVVLVVILPMLFSRVLIDPLITVRYICLGCFILLFILFFYILRKTPVNLSFQPLIKTVFALGIGYGLWSMVCMFFAINLTPGYYEVGRHFLNIVLLFLIMDIVKREESQVLKLCKALMIVSLIQSLVGILQNYELAFTGIPGGSGPYGLMGNRNLFGSAQVLLLPFVIFVLYKASKAWKYGSIIAIMAIIVSVVISQTRSAWVSTIVVVIITLILIIVFSRVNRKIWIMGTLTGLIGIVGIVAVIWLHSNSDPQSVFSRYFKEKVYDLFEDATVNTISSGRISLWSKSIELMKDHSFVGVGPANWQLAIPAYGSEGTARAEGLMVPSRPHNVYIQVACETGIPGFILYSGMWVLITIIGFKIILKSKSEDVRVLIILMLAGFTAFATDSLFSFPTERIEHSLYIILMGGTILGSYANVSKTEKEKGRSINKWLLISFFLIIIFNLFLGYKKYNFEKHMHLAKDYRKQNRNEEVLSEVEAGKNKYVTIDPNGEPLEIHSSAAYRELKNYQEALEEIIIAHNYHPNSARILTTMGVIYANLKQYDMAINCYLQALQLTPRYEIALKNLAGVYFASGNYAACIEILGKVNIQNNQYLTNLLNEAKRRREEQ